MSPPQESVLIEALLDVSKAMVAVAARSLDDLHDDLTLPAFRLLVVLHTAGSMPTTALAERVGIHQSTASRIAARLTRDGLVQRDTDASDRRVTRVSLTGRGATLVERVLQRRRDELATVVRELGGQRAGRLLEALQDVAQTVQRLSGPADDWRL